MVIWAEDGSGKSLAGRRTTDGSLTIQNDTNCTLYRTHCKAVNIHNWKKNFPEKIEPGSNSLIYVNFVTKSRILYDETKGECVYAAYDRNSHYVCEFVIHADAAATTSNVFRGNIEVKWGNFANIFGVKVKPVDGKIGFKHNGVVTIALSGSPLPAAERDAGADGNESKWMTWNVLTRELTVGDIVAANRGIITHYGIVEETPITGIAMLTHLNGTAGALLRRHPATAPVQVYKALTKHGDIAEVCRTSLEEFSGGDPVRIENTYDKRLKPFPPDTIQERIRVAIGHKDYSLREFNCEHYVHLMRYGVTYSGQAEEVTRLESKLKLKSYPLVGMSLYATKGFVAKSFDEAKRLKINRPMSVNDFQKSVETPVLLVDEKQHVSNDIHLGESAANSSPNMDSSASIEQSHDGLINSVDVNNAPEEKSKFNFKIPGRNKKKVKLSKNPKEQIVPMKHKESVVESF